MIGLHVVPVVERRSAAKKDDVGRERSPPLEPEPIAASLRMIERRFRGHDQVDAEVHHLAREDFVSLTGVGLRDGDALVDALVAELLGVLRAEVIVKELVAVIEARRSEVSEPEVGADRHDRERERGPFRPTAAPGDLPREERRFPHRQGRGSEGDRGLDPPEAMIVDATRR